MLSLGEQTGSDLRQQLLEDEPHSRVDGVIADDHAIAGAEEHTSDDLFIGILQFEDREGQVGVHALAGLILHDLVEPSAAVGEDALGNLSVFSFQLDGDISLHHSEHALSRSKST